VNPAMVQGSDTVVITVKAVSNLKERVNPPIVNDWRTEARTFILKKRVQHAT